jgi:hypothetical protein
MNEIRKYAIETAVLFSTKADDLVPLARAIEAYLTEGEAPTPASGGRGSLRSGLDYFWDQDFSNPYYYALDHHNDLIYRATESSGFQVNGYFSSIAEFLEEAADNGFERISWDHVLPEFAVKH